MTEQRPSKDLVSRLRGWYHNEDISTGDTVLLIGEAAGEIERLHRELEHMADMQLAAAVNRPAPEPPAALPKPINHDLWRHLHDEHGLTLLQSELDEILRIAQPPGALLDDETIVWKCGCGWINLDRESPFCAGCDKRRNTLTKETSRIGAGIPPDGAPSMPANETRGGHG